MPVFKSWQLDLVPSENWEHLAKTLLVQGFPLKLSWQMATSFYLNTPNTGFSCLICVPSKFICYSPNSNAAVFGDGAAKEVIKIKWVKGNLIGKGIMSTQDETPELILSPSPSMYWGKTMRRHSEKAAICKPGKEISLETQSARTWPKSSSLQPCEKTNFSCLSHLGHGILFWQLTNNTSCSTRWLIPLSNNSKCWKFPILSRNLLSAASTQ